MKKIKSSITRQLLTIMANDHWYQLGWWKRPPSVNNLHRVSTGQQRRNVAYKHYGEW